jgi:hypothetical protein
MSSQVFGKYVGGKCANYIWENTVIYMVKGYYPSRFLRAILKLK